MKIQYITSLFQAFAQTDKKQYGLIEADLYLVKNDNKFTVVVLPALAVFARENG